jgi:hypothetical protein
VQEPSAVQPCIRVRGAKDGNPLSSRQLSIAMDGVQVVEEDAEMDVSLAISCLMALYFVYSVQYPARLRNTMLFFEKFVFKLSKDTVPVTVQRAYDLVRQ